MRYATGSLAAKMPSKQTWCFIVFLFFVVYSAAVICFAMLGDKLCLHDCKADAQGYSFIKKSEGFYPFVYRDAAGFATVAFGHRVLPGEHFSHPVIGETADMLFLEDVAKAERDLNRFKSGALAALPVDGLVDFRYNLPLRDFKKIMAIVNAGNLSAACAHILRYDHAGGRELTGLKRRRQGEVSFICGES